MPCFPTDFREVPANVLRKLCSKSRCRKRFARERWKEDCSLRKPCSASIARSRSASCASREFSSARLPSSRGASLPERKNALPDVKLRSQTEKKKKTAFKLDHTSLLQQFWKLWSKAFKSSSGCQYCKRRRRSRARKTDQLTAPRPTPFPHFSNST